MNVGRARRRWLKWCRYVQKTQTLADPRRRWGTGAHAGQARAYQDAMFAGRYAPKGVRNVWYPRWGNAK